MVQPASVINTRGQSTDSIYGLDGVERVKLAVGDVDVTLTPMGAWQGVATHQDADAFNASDGIVVVGGVDLSDGVTPRKAAVDQDGRFVVATIVEPGNLTDYSGTVTVGGAADEVMAANVSRKYLFIQNAEDATDLWINLGVVAVEASPSIRLAPGASFVMEGSFISSQALSAISSLTGHVFTAKEG